MVPSLPKYANCIFKFSQTTNKSYLYNQSFIEWFKFLKCCICWPSDSFAKKNYCIKLMICFKFALNEHAVGFVEKS